MKRYKEFYFPLCVSVIVFIGNALENNIIIYFGSIVMMSAILFKNTNTLFMHLVFYIPNIRMFRPMPEGNTMIGIFIILLCVRYLIKKSVKIDIKHIIIITLIFLIILINGDMNMVFPTIRFSSMFLVIIYYLKENRECILQKYKDIEESFLIGSVITVVLGVAYYTIFQGVDILSFRFGGIRNDPNFYSLVMLSAFTLSFLRMLYKKGSYLLPIIFLISGMLSNSRMFLICIAICIVSFILLSGVKNIKKIIALIVVALIASIIFSGTIINITNEYILRFEEENITTASGRTDINEMYIELWNDSIYTKLFGLGEYQYLSEKGIVDMAHHNYYVQLISSIGIIGTAVVSLIYIVIWRNTNYIEDKKQLKLITFVPLFGQGVALLSLPALFSDSHLITIVISMLAIRVYSYNYISEYISS